MRLKKATSLSALIINLCMQICPIRVPKWTVFDFTEKLQIDTNNIYEPN